MLYSYFTDQKNKEANQTILFPKWNAKERTKKTKKSEFKSRLSLRLPRAGLEPARLWSHQILSLACLPVPSPRLIWLSQYSKIPRKIKTFLYKISFFLLFLNKKWRKIKLNLNNFQIFFLLFFFNFLSKN